MSAPRGARREKGDPFQAVMLVGLWLLGGAAALVWATVQVAARLFADQWATLDVDELPGVLAALASEPGRPADAFPAEVAQLLPGPVTFWAILAGLLLPLVGLLGMAVRVKDRKPKHASADLESARLATRRDLRSLLLRRPAPGRLVLGKAHRRIVAVEPLQAVIVLAPQRTGKSSGIAIPALLEHDGPVIATSIRTDLVEATLARRSQLGTTWIYEPTGQLAGGRRTAGWDPLGGCLTWQGALRTATRLCDAGQQGASMNDGAFWSATAAKLLALLLYAAAVSDRSIADVVRWVDRQEEQEIRLELELAGEAAAIDAAEASWAREDRLKSSAYTTAEVALRAFADPAVAATTARGEITAERLYDGGSHTLFVCAPNHEQDRLQPLFSGLLGQMIAAAYDRHAVGRPLERPLLILLDEAANIAPLTDLDTLASTAAGTGIQLVSIWQDMAQIQVRYGQRAATVVNNHRAKLVLSGISDQPTLDYVSRLAGETEVSRESRSVDGEGRRSTTESTEHRPLSPADALRRLPPGHGLLLYGHLPPARLQLRQWFKDRSLRQLASGEAIEEATSPAAGDTVPAPLTLATTWPPVDDGMVGPSEYGDEPEPTGAP